MASTKFAEVAYSLKDSSTLPVGRSPIAAGLGITERGVPNKPRLISSFREFEKYFGGLLPQSVSLFPFHCKVMLDAGVQMFVSRIEADGNTDVAPSFTNDDFTIQGYSTGDYEVEFTITNASNGEADYCNLSATVNGNDSLAERLTNVPRNPNAQEKKNIEDFFTFIDEIVPDAALVGFLLKNSSVTLTGGTYDTASIANNDYIGTELNETGFYAFNEFKPKTIATYGYTDGDVGSALATYCQNRGDVIALISVPYALNVSGAVDYRRGEGSFSHAPIDYFGAWLFYAGVEIRYPLTGGVIQMSELSFVTRNIILKDVQQGHRHGSFGGERRGVVKGIISPIHSFSTPAKRGDADLLLNNSINIFIERDGLGTIIWGNETSQRNATLLQKAHVADLVIGLRLDLVAIGEKYLFEPLVPSLFRTITEDMRRIMATLVNQSGITADFEIIGDQDIQNIEDLANGGYNTLDDINNDTYKVAVVFSPVSIAKRIEITAELKNIGSVGEITITQLP